MFVAMNEGRVQGMLCVGKNPATSLNASVERKGLARLEWLVVKDNWLTETATFWQNSPEITSGQLKSEDVRTEVFFFPSAQVAEYEGSFTNTQRMLQWHFKAARSEEHTSELQSRPHLVCRLLLEKKKKKPFGRVSIRNSTPP